jgi:glycosyltransferase involved in cell wall biosynthesis
MTPMRIVLVSDAWHPQVNGVVRTLGMTVDLLRRAGHVVLTITPDMFVSVPCPTYPEIRLALTRRSSVARLISDFRPDAIHIATEGPLGWLTRNWCIARGISFTTSFHTRFPDYVAARTGIGTEWLWRSVKRFHAPARHVLVATQRLADELHQHGLMSTRLWSRGVDLEQFRPGLAPHPALAGLARPVQLSVGRVAIEKNLEAFLSADTPGSKVVVGDGPALATLRTRYPGVTFLGSLKGAELAAAYAAADVFVFPSLTDTFGLVMLEALACGVPVAAFPVAGPLDVIGTGCGVVPKFGAQVGAVNDDLATAIMQALGSDPADCAGYARNFGWAACAAQFLESLAELDVAIAA